MALHFILAARAAYALTNGTPAPFAIPLVAAAVPGRAVTTSFALAGFGMVAIVPPFS